MASTAEKLDPELWEQAKADARDAFGGHSARAMQLAVKLYKQRGGRYRGPKKTDNRLTQWSRQNWKTKSGRPSRETGERYLPAAAIESLTPAEYGATTRAKRRGGGVGSVVAQPQSIREKTRKFRKVNPDMATTKQIAARKKFAERARSGELARMRKKSTRKKNPAATVSDEISAQMRKGKPQKQAVAIALEMERAGKLKKNPISDVAQTIYQQLGANRFVAMTGAKNFVGGEDYLMFSIPRNMSPYNKVKITYVPGRDLYDVDFMKVTSAGGVAKGEPYNDVYAEQLRELFTSVTGMETSLGTMGRRANPTATRAASRKTNPDGKKFVVGKYYETRLITDSNSKVGALILGRTEKSVTVQGTDNLMKTKYRLTNDYQGNEMFFPYGRYSMAPQIGADDERKSNPTATRPGRSRTKLVSNGGRKSNPATKDVFFVNVIDDGGFQFGMDDRTPVLFKFSNREMKKGVYRSFALPFNVTSNAEFQNFVKSLPGNQIVISLKDLRKQLSAYA